MINIQSSPSHYPIIAFSLSSSSQQPFVLLVFVCLFVCLQQMKEASRVKIDLIVIGNPNSGKTSLIRRFIEGQTAFTQFYTPTLGISLDKKVIQLDGNEVTVCIWDTAGQEKFFSLTKNYFKKADGVLVVFDLTDKPSFDRVDKFWVPEIKEKSDEDCPQILIGNKRDMPNERVVSSETAKQLSESIGIRYFQTSAKTGEGVEQSIEFLVRECLKRVSYDSGGQGFGLEAVGPSGGGCMSSFKEFFSDLRNRFK